MFLTLGAAGSRCNAPAFGRVARRLLLRPPCVTGNKAMGPERVKISRIELWIWRIEEAIKLTATGKVLPSQEKKTAMASRTHPRHVQPIHILERISYVCVLWASNLLLPPSGGAWYKLLGGQCKNMSIWGCKLLKKISSKPFPQKIPHSLVQSWGRREGGGGGAPLLCN